MNGEKNIEVRKESVGKAVQKLIDEQGFADIYVYCTKEESLIYTDGTDGKGDYVDYKYYESYKGNKNDIGSGKVLFKFRCYKVDEFPYINDRYDELIGSCLSEKEILDYSTIKEENGIRFVKTIYAIHISDLEIFDRPKELSEFKSYKKNIVNTNINGMVFETELDNSLIKAPQNYCYVEVD